MKITSATPAAYEFACQSAACAPPPVGSGGSMKGWKAIGFGGGRALRTTKHIKVAKSGIYHVNPKADGTAELTHGFRDGKRTKVGDYPSAREAMEYAEVMDAAFGK